MQEHDFVSTWQDCIFTIGYLKKSAKTQENEIMMMVKNVCLVLSHDKELILVKNVISLKEIWTHSKQYRHLNLTFTFSPLI